MKGKFFAISVTLGLMLSQVALAEDVPTMDEVVVTASRTPVSLDKVGGSSVTVITAADIKAKQQTTVAQVLKGVPGLDIVSNGGVGTSTSVFIRGADAKNTLVMVDGVMFNDPSSSNRGANLANLTTDNIERIEIVRGPMSVLYGSNATAGVVNIITKKGKGRPQVSFGAEGGSYDTWKLYGGSSGSLDRLNYSADVSHTGTGGFSIADNNNDRLPQNGNTSEKDGWKNTSVSGKLGFDVNRDFNIATTLRYMNSDLDEDDYGNGYTGDRFDSSWPPVAEPDGLKDRHAETEQYLGRVEVNNRFFNEALDSNLYFQTSRHDRLAFDNDGAESYDYVGKSRETGWQGSFNVLEANRVTIGSSFYKENMQSLSSSITGENAQTVSFWGQEQLTLLDKLELLAGLRHDNHDRFGGKTTYRLAPSYATDFGLLLKASYGTGFRAPSLYELFSAYGNVNLAPEESKGWDAGFEQKLANGKIKFGITGFAVTYDDRIDYDYFTSKYQQATGKTKTQGVETFIDWQPNAALGFLLNYTYTDTEDPDGLRLVRRPLNKVALDARYRYGKARFNLDCRWVGDRDASPFAADKDGSPVGTLASYTVVNLAARYEPAEHVEIYGRIDNLFDEYYEEAWSYATPGISAYAGFKLKY